MDWLTRALDWFAGGSRNYMTLYHCMDHDVLWVSITVMLDLAVAAGYTLIALHWWRNQKTLTDPRTRRALGNMRDIFIFCGICGYLFIPIKMIWPAWRLYDLFMVVLVYLTWRYAWGARDLKVVYQAINRSDELQTQLDETREQVERRSFFLNAISHDLKNPLYAISLQTQVAELAIERQDPQQLRQTMANIRAATKDANRLVEQFLELGRANRLDDAGFDEHAAVVCRELLQRLAGAEAEEARRKSIDLVVDAPPDLSVYTHPPGLERIVSNLVNNAVKFTDAGSVTLGAQSVNGDILIHVTDTGRGIDANHTARIFDEFYQANNDERERSRGYGLGLAIAHRLAQRLGGTIRVESEPGKGSRFTLVLPNREPVAVEPTPVGAGR